MTGGPLYRCAIMCAHLSINVDAETLTLNLPRFSAGSVQCLHNFDYKFAGLNGSDLRTFLHVRLAQTVAALEKRLGRGQGVARKLQARHSGYGYVQLPAAS